MIKLRNGVLDDSHVPLLQKLEDVLAVEPDPVRRQIALELLCAKHAWWTGDAHADFVAAAIHKHVLQIIGQLRLPADHTQ